MKKLLTTLCSTAGVAIFLSASASFAQSITLAVPDWTGGQITCQIVTKVLQQANFRTKRVEIPSGPATLEAMANGDIDAGCELWPSYVPAISEYFNEYGGDGSIMVIGEQGIRGSSGYYVPRYLVEGSDAKAKDLKHFTDLAKYADLFKTVETGARGRLIGCPVTSWECDDQARADAYGVPFEAIALGTETAHWTEIKGAYNRKEAFVAYMYDPHWILAELDMVPLGLDDYGDGEAWPKSGWAVDIPFNYGRPDLDPRAVAIIKRTKLGNEDQVRMILEVDVNGREVDEVVDEWLDANSAKVEAWIK